MEGWCGDRTRCARGCRRPVRWGHRGSPETSSQDPATDPLFCDFSNLHKRRKLREALERAIGGWRLFRVLRRLWIPLVILVVIAAGGFTVSRLHGIFGSEKRPSYADTKIDDAKPFDPKHLTYEVFGPPGTVADISYFDVNGEPQFVEGASLPWSLKFAITQAASVGNIVAQGDSDSIGCRIVVDGEVKAERISNEVNAFHLLLAEGRMSNEHLSNEHTAPPFVARTIHRFSVPIILAWLAIAVIVNVGVPPLEQVEKEHSVSQSPEDAPSYKAMSAWVRTSKNLILTVWR